MRDSHSQKVQTVHLTWAFLLWEAGERQRLTSCLGLKSSFKNAAVITKPIIFYPEVVTAALRLRWNPGRTCTSE